MKVLAILFTVLVAQTVHADSTDIVFSNYDESLSLTGTNAYGAHVFEGPITVQGNLRLSFYLGSDGSPLDVNARLFPDDKSLNRLPNVISGHMTGDASLITLEPGEKALHMALGEMEVSGFQRGTEVIIEIPVSVEVIQLLTGGQCGGSRAYWTTNFSVLKLDQPAFKIAMNSHGC